MWVWVDWIGWELGTSGGRIFIDKRPVLKGARVEGMEGWRGWTDGKEEMGKGWDVGLQGGFLGLGFFWFFFFFFFLNKVNIIIFLM